MLRSTAESTARALDLREDAPVAPAPAERKREALAECHAPASRRSSLSPVVLTGLVRLLELGLIAAAAGVVHWFYLGAVQPVGSDYMLLVAGVCALFLPMSGAFSAHSVFAYRHVYPTIMRLVGALGAVFLVAMGAMFFLKLEGTFSRVWFLGWFCAASAALLVERVVLAAAVRFLTRSGRLEKRTVVVGGGPACEELLTSLARDPDSDLRIFGFFDDRTDARSPEIVAGYPKLGTVDDLVEMARHTRIDLVIFSMPITAEQRLLQMLRKLWVLPINIRLAAHMNKLRFRPRSYSYIGNVPVLDVFDKPIADWDIVVKSVFDRVVGALALVILSPVLLGVALAVKLDSRGPVLFRQKRYGFNNELIDVFKFRSMYVDKLDFNADKLATRDDPRITRVGRFIRRTSLDELPQLFNVVFKGDLSLVGPRPHAIHAKAANRQYEQVVDGYFARHRVRPGITGWAQINGWRGGTDTSEQIQKRVEHDLFYIENWSILFDVYILLRTPFALLKGENAY